MVSAGQAYNLLAGRAIQNIHVSTEGLSQNVWMQLDFNDKDAAGNYKIKEFHVNYGYDLKQVLQQFPIKELKSQEATEKLMHALLNGDKRVISILKDGKEQKFSIEANPQFKSVNIYDENLKKVSIATALGSKTVDPVQMSKRIGQKPQTTQSSKNGLSVI